MICSVAVIFAFLNPLENFFNITYTLTVQISRNYVQFLEIWLSKQINESDRLANLYSAQIIRRGQIIQTIPEWRQMNILQELPQGRT